MLSLGTNPYGCGSRTSRPTHVKLCLQADAYPHGEASPKSQGMRALTLTELPELQCHTTVHGCSQPCGFPFAASSLSPPQQNDAAGTRERFREKTDGSEHIRPTTRLGGLSQVMYPKGAPSSTAKRFRVPLPEVRAAILCFNPVSVQQEAPKLEQGFQGIPRRWRAASMVMGAHKSPSAQRAAAPEITSLLPSPLSPLPAALPQPSRRH